MAAPKISIDYKIKDGKTNISNPYQFDDLKSFYEFTRGSLIKIARDALQEEQARGFDKNPVIVVDNKRGVQIDKVNPLGKIQFVARSELKEILIFAFEAIDSRTPELTGFYKNSNIVVYNGTQVADDRSSFYAWLEKNPAFSPKDKIRFVNGAPYARKLERYRITAQNRGNGKSKAVMRDAPRSDKAKFGTKYFVPNGVYTIAHRSIQRKYKNIAVIRMDFVPGGSLGLPSKRYKRGKSAGMAYLYPTILIQATQSGLL